jgi:hypothetical protein
MLGASVAINEYVDEPLFQGQSKNGKPIVYWGEGDPFLNGSLCAWRKVTDWLLQEENLIIFAGCGWLVIPTVTAIFIMLL